MNKEKFIEKCKETHDVEYRYDRVPENFNTKEKPYFEIGCPICGGYWKVRYDQFQKGSNCPNCTKTGRKIKDQIKREWCKKNNILLIEKNIEDLNTINKIENFIKSALK